MSSSFAIIGGHVVSPIATYRSDLVIQDGKITWIGDLNRKPTGNDIDASGLHIFPGAIDTQVHFREPGLEWKEDLTSGTRAAIAGGVTTIFEMPNTNPTTTTKEALEDKLARAAARCWCDYGFFFGASTDNLGYLAEAENLPGTPGIKLFAGSSTGTLLVENESDIRQVFQNGRRPVAIHSEFEPRLRERKAKITPNGVQDHPKIRDAEAARLCTEMLIRLSEETGRHIHVLHISTAEEVELIREAKRRGVKITCEITPQHLTFSADDYALLGTKLQQNPPIRAKEHRAALWPALLEGMFDVFGSDHAPHTLEEKAKPYPDSPSGMPGVQTIFPLLLDYALKGQFSLHALVRMMSETPAKLYGLRNKGVIAPGYDADLCLVDLSASWMIQTADLHSKCGWSPFEGRELKGRIQNVFVRGIQADLAPIGQPAEYTWK